MGITKDTLERTMVGDTKIERRDMAVVLAVPVALTKKIMATYIAEDLMMIVVDMAAITKDTMIIILVIINDTATKVVTAKDTMKKLVIIKDTATMMAIIKDTVTKMVTIKDTATLITLTETEIHRLQLGIRIVTKTKGSTLIVDIRLPVNRGPAACGRNTAPMPRMVHKVTSDSLIWVIKLVNLLTVTGLIYVDATVAMLPRNATGVNKMVGRCNRRQTSIPASRLHGGIPLKITAKHSSIILAAGAEDMTIDKQTLQITTRSSTAAAVTAIPTSLMQTTASEAARTRG